MTIRLYFDEDSMSHSLTTALRIRGIDVLTALESGLTNVSDESQLEFAASEHRVIFSFNVQDYTRLHVAFLSGGKTHAGMVVSQQQQFSIGEQMRRLLKLMAALSADDMIDRLEFLGAWR
jgi:uncharacterized protein with PIN domain